MSDEREPDTIDGPSQPVPDGSGLSDPPRPSANDSFLSTIYPRVFVPAAALIVTFVLFGAIATETLGSATDTIRDSIVGGLGW